jgi:hypothetical protein
MPGLTLAARRLVRFGVNVVVFWGRVWQGLVVELSVRISKVGGFGMGGGQESGRGYIESWGTGFE